MPQTKSSPDYKMYFWTLVFVLVLLGGLYMLKKSAKLMLLQKAATQQEAVDDRINDRNELDETSKQLDETNVDATLDAELKLLQDDASAL